MCIILDQSFLLPHQMQGCFFISLEASCNVSGKKKSIEQEMFKKKMSFGFV